jgi:hypothetical protein
MVLCHRSIYASNGIVGTGRPRGRRASRVGPNGPSPHAQVWNGHPGSALLSSGEETIVHGEPRLPLAEKLSSPHLQVVWLGPRSSNAHSLRSGSLIWTSLLLGRASRHFSRSAAFSRAPVAPARRARAASAVQAPSLMGWLRATPNCSHDQGPRSRGPAGQMPKR